MTVLTRSETNRLRIYLRHLDPHAFITIVNSSEIIGKGSEVFKYQKSESCNHLS